MPFLQLQVNNASYALTASFADTASFIQTTVSASHAVQSDTASFAPLYLTTASFNTWTSSVEGLSNFNAFTQSVSASYVPNAATLSFASTTSLNSLSSSVAVTDTNQNTLISGLTAGFNNYTASVSKSYVPNSVTSSMTVLSSSYAITASNLLSFTANSNPFTIPVFYDNFQIPNQVLTNSSTASSGQTYTVTPSTDSPQITSSAVYAGTQVLTGTTENSTYYLSTTLTKPVKNVGATFYFLPNTGSGFTNGTLLIGDPVSNLNNLIHIIFNRAQFIIQATNTGVPGLVSLGEFDFSGGSFNPNLLLTDGTLYSISAILQGNECTVNYCGKTMTVTSSLITTITNMLTPTVTWEQFCNAATTDKLYFTYIYSNTPGFPLQPGRDVAIWTKNLEGLSNNNQMAYGPLLVNYGSQYGLGNNARGALDANGDIWASGNLHGNVLNGGSVSLTNGGINMSGTGSQINITNQSGATSLGITCYGGWSASPTVTLFMGDHQSNPQLQLVKASGSTHPACSLVHYNDQFPFYPVSSGRGSAISGIPYNQDGSAPTDFFISDYQLNTPTHWFTAGGRNILGTWTDDGSTRLQVAGAIKQTAFTSSIAKTTSTGILTSASLGTDYTTFVSIPTSISGSGTAGTMAYGAGFLYVCTGSNAWGRVALSSF